MTLSRNGEATRLASIDTAPQHGPRPLPLFLALLRAETAASPERRAAALAGLAAYQQAERRATAAPAPVVATAGRARLLGFGGDGPPLLLVPSLINPPDILALAGERSFAGWLATQGFRPLLLDWGSPAPGEAALSVAGHVETLLLPLIDALGEPPLVAGYCLGGTMALAAAMLRPLSALALIAAPFRFSGFGDGARADIAALWAGAKPPAAAMGLVPMEVLQTGFWRLDPGRTIAKYEAFGRLDPASAAARNFVAVEDWANAGAPLTYAAGRELMEDFVAADRPGSGGWRVGGRIVDPAALACPALDIVSTSDRIVPAASAAGLPERISLGAGHVGMVVGGRARAQLWQPLASWLSRAASA